MTLRFRLTTDTAVSAPDEKIAELFVKVLSSNPEAVYALSKLLAEHAPTPAPTPKKKD